MTTVNLVMLNQVYISTLYWRSTIKSQVVVLHLGSFLGVVPSDSKVVNNLKIIQWCSI